MPNRIQLKFWGVRGSIPTPVRENLGFGGNTSCLEVRLPGGEILIIDGGTGARSLGEGMVREATGQPLDLHFFITHFHWDHIHGIPFFQPLYCKENTVSFYAMTAPARTAAFLKGQMASPYYPVDSKFLLAKRNFVQAPGREFQFGETRVTSFPLNHPQGCLGYRLQHESSTLVFASDFEHGDPMYDRMLLDAAQGADVLVLDAQYTPAEYKTRCGWGHSTWLEATRIAKEAGAGRLILFHHDPQHDDVVMKQILLGARLEFQQTSIATEGEEIAIG